MRIRVGTMFVGKVDSFGQESIQTKFFILGLPLVPLESYYCLRSTGIGIEGFAIPTHWKSVLCAYLRWWLAPLSLTLGICAIVSGQLALAILSGVGILIAFLSFLFGRLSPAEKHRRVVLRASTGLGAPPSVLPPSITDKVLRHLESQWEQRISDSALEDWRNISSLDAVKLGLLPSLFCLASYAGESEMAENAWQRIEQNWHSIDQ